MAHYDWDCETCDYSGGVYDHYSLIKLSQPLFIPFSGNKTTNTIRICKTCNQKFQEGQSLCFQRTVQFFSKKDEAVKFFISLDEVQSILESARRLAELYRDEELGADTEMEDYLIYLVCAFQKLRDGYPGDNALEENWDKLHQQLLQFDPEDFLG